MHLSKLNSFNSKNGIDQKLFWATYQKEILAYRKKPKFWVSMVVVLVLSLIIIYRLDMIGRIILLPIIFGLACIHDTITFHFTNRLIEKENEMKK